MIPVVIGFGLVAYLLLRGEKAKYPHSMYDCSQQKQKKIIKEWLILVMFTILKNVMAVQHGLIQMKMKMVIVWKATKETARMFV